MNTEILRPNAPGDETNLIKSGSGGYNYDRVNEETPDYFASYVSTLELAYHRDLYNIANHSVGNGTINFIKVYALCVADFEPDRASLKIAIKSGTGTGTPTTVSEGSPKTLTIPEFELHSSQWNTNPATGEKFTWDEIDKLQIGLALCSPYSESEEYSFCTQIYVEIDYTPQVAPTVTTQAVTNIAATTATGNGNITDVGSENCDKKGVCWNTGGNPTVADDKSEETDSFGTGAFTSSMTGLSAGTKYYVKAYAHNSAGYGYGSQVEFTTKGYYSSGYIGDVIDCTVLVDTYDRLEWAEELPSANQAVKIEIRSSPDNSTWSDWETIYSSPCTSFATPVQRYLEWRATLTTSDPSATPKLKDLLFDWSKTEE